MIAVQEVVRLCSDIDDTRRWYQEVLGLIGEIVMVDKEYFSEIFSVSIEKALRISVGDESFLFLESPTAVISVSVPGDNLAFQHLALVVNNIESVVTHLQDRNVVFISESLQELPSSNKDAGGIRAIYFQDNNGYALELIWYPEDKRKEKWAEKMSSDISAKNEIIGIDHSAITVRKTAMSMEFYENLGFMKVGESHNFGREQELLSGVRGADVIITALRADAGYGVELLEYKKNSLADSKNEEQKLFQALFINSSEAKNVFDPDGHVLIFLNKGGSNGNDT